MGSVKPIFDSQTALKVFEGTLKIISFLLFPVGHSRLRKLDRRIRDGMDG